MYDYFRNRLIFPIRDSAGRTIAFGGRELGSGQPKYLNTPQTPLFDKSATLFGLDLARDAIRRGNRVIIVEGYMDVVVPISTARATSSPASAAPSPRSTSVRSRS